MAPWARAALSCPLFLSAAVLAHSTSAEHARIGHPFKLLLPFATLAAIAGAAHPTTTEERILPGGGHSSAPLSRPPAPLFSSAGTTHITLSVRLDPNDDGSRGNVQRYEFEREEVARHQPKSAGAIVPDFRGVWTSLGRDAVPSSVLGGAPATVTATGLEPRSSHRFRVRAVGENNGAKSPWSLPSSPYVTLPSTPMAPSNLTAKDVRAHSIELSWSAPHTEKGSLPLLSYDVQYRRQFISTVVGDKETDRNLTQWVTHPEFIPSNSKVATREVQEVTTLVDESSSISSGHFWLRVRIPLLDPTSRSTEAESSFLSEAIPFDATAEQFEEALKSIANVGNVRVFRYGETRANETAVRGTYSWRVEFNDFDGPHAWALPLLEVHNNTLDGTHTAVRRRARIEVRRLQSGKAAALKESASVAIGNLDEYTFYDFRVRAANSDGYGPWSDVLSIRSKPDLSPDGDSLSWPDSRDSQNEDQGQGIDHPGHPSKPFLVSISHNAFTVGWHPENGAGHYEVEVSGGRGGAGSEGGRCSEEFELVDHVLNKKSHQILSSTLDGLTPDSVYCVRTLAVAVDGLHSTRSDTLEVITPLPPTNEWRRITPRGYHPDSKHASSRLCQDQPTPSARRGHSMTVLEGQVYLFGGVAEECACDNEPCVEGTKHVPASDLWKFDYKSAVFTRLRMSSSTSPWPVGREQHSATAVKGRGSIFVIGGLTYAENDGDSLILGDTWELKLGRTTSHIVEGTPNSQALLDGNVLYQTAHFQAENELCVKDIKVQVSMDHECAGQVHSVALHGPGPKPNTPHFVPESRGHRVKLFSRADLADNTCTFLSSNVTYADSAADSVLSYGPGLPASGILQPAEALGPHFVGSPANGEWTLAVHESVTDGISGTLKNWRLHIEASACTQAVSWEKKTTNACEKSYSENGRIITEDCHHLAHSDVESFSPRHLHSAISVGDYIFVTGGFSRRAMQSDLWRYSVANNKWTKLLGAVDATQKWYGQASALIPTGMLSLGGIIGEGKGDLNPYVWHYNVFNETWSALPVANPNSQPRYLFPVSYLDGYPEPLVLQHGGDSGLPEKRYLQDISALSLANLFMVEETSVESLRGDHCSWQIRAGSAGLRIWEESCGTYANTSSGKVCRRQDILVQAWCRKEHQNFYSLA